MTSNLVGPDGKPLEAPVQRPVPNRQEKFNLVFMMFTLMDREERRQLRKALKTLQPRLDLMYPMGMKEGDIKNELTKAAGEVVPNEEGHAEPQVAEVAAEPSVPVEQKVDADNVEAAAPSEEGGC